MQKKNIRHFTKSTRYACHICILKLSNELNGILLIALNQTSVRLSFRKQKKKIRVDIDYDFRRRLTLNLVKFNARKKTAMKTIHERIIAPSWSTPRLRFPLMHIFRRIVNATEVKENSHTFLLYIAWVNLSCAFVTGRLRGIEIGLRTKINSNLVYDQLCWKLYWPVCFSYRNNLVIGNKCSKNLFAFFFNSCTIKSCKSQNIDTIWFIRKSKCSCTLKYVSKDLKNKRFIA